MVNKNQRCEDCSFSALKKCTGKGVDGMFCSIYRKNPARENHYLGVSMKTCKTCKYFGAPDVNGFADCNCKETKFSFVVSHEPSCEHYQDYDEDLYCHQVRTTTGYFNKFLFVHHDNFGRAFENAKEIEEKLCNSYYVANVEPISRNCEGKINIFGLKVFSKEPIDSINKLYENCHEIEMLETIYYYTGITCDYQCVK